MLTGLLLPLLRKFSARVRMLAGISVMAAGLALALSLLLRAHASGSVPLIRVGILLTLAGPGLIVSSVRSSRRDRQGHGSDPEQADGQP